MIKKLKKYSLITLTMVIFIALNTFGVLAADDSVFDLGTRTTNDVTRTWTFTFSDNVDFTSAQDNIQIKDITTGKFLSTTLTKGESNNIVKVNPPSGGYTVGHSYLMSINKNIKLEKGVSLPKTTIATFVVLSKNMSDYNVSASVTVSPAISVFKQITITSTNLPGAQKYKIEGNKKLFDIGKTSVSMVAGDTAKVYICDYLGNVLGTVNMDVSTTKSNMKINLQ